jgi:hypothetical protein
MGMRLTVIIAAMGLSACATTPAMEGALAPLTGQPVQLVFDRLGSPTSVTPSGADTVYVWQRTSMVPGASMRTGSIGGDTPTNGYGGTYSGVPVPVECNIQIVADAEGRIKDSDYIGARGGCREPAKKLRQLAYSEPR